MTLLHCHNKCASIGATVLWPTWEVNRDHTGDCTRGTAFGFDVCSIIDDHCSESQQVLPE